MCAQRRLRSAWAYAQSDQSFCFRSFICWSLRTQAFFMRTAKTLIRLKWYAVWQSGSSKLQCSRSAVYWWSDHDHLCTQMSLTVIQGLCNRSADFLFNIYALWILHKLPVIAGGKGYEYYAKDVTVLNMWFRLRDWVPIYKGHNFRDVLINKLHTYLLKKGIDFTRKE